MGYKKVIKHYGRLLVKTLKAEHKKKYPDIMICDDMARVYNVLQTGRERKKARSKETCF